MIPEGDHTRKVEGADRSANANRLAEHDLVDTRRNIFRDNALHHHRDATGYLNVLDRPAHLGFGLFECFTAFHRDGSGDIVEICIQQILQLEEILDTFRRRHSAPGGERSGGGLNRLVHFCFWG